MIEKKKKTTPPHHHTPGAPLFLLRGFSAGPFFVGAPFFISHPFFFFPRVFLPPRFFGGENPIFPPPLEREQKPPPPPPPQRPGAPRDFRGGEKGKEPPKPPHPLLPPAWGVFFNTRGPPLFSVGKRGPGGHPNLMWFISFFCPPGFSFFFSGFYFGGNWGGITFSPGNHFCPGFPQAPI
eukprot:FR742745.1.p1 GENE.FR742745.1~~FR742745.1.p1  ORF type:complete len:180 (-),score=117.25 FR742745.1:647-1186(-)